MDEFHWCRQDVERRPPGLEPAEDEQLLCSEGHRLKVQPACCKSYERSMGKDGPDCKARFGSHC